MKSRPSERIAYQTRIKGNWKNVSWSEYFRQIEAVGTKLLSLGVQPQDRVALMSNTRWEWAVTDLAVMSIHAITVPIYQTVTAEDLEYILNDSKAKILILENRNMIKLFLTVRDRCPTIEHVLVIDEIRDNDSEFVAWTDAFQNPSSHLEKHRHHFDNLIRSTGPDQVATLIYTSGTTGRPRGVILTHTQIMSEIAEAFAYAGANPDDVSLSFLPYAHVLGRIEYWGHVHIGFTLAFAESIEKIRANLLQIQPTIMVSVPRIFEKVHAAILTQIEASVITKKIFHEALKVGLKVSRHKQKAEPISIKTHLKYLAAKKIALDKVKDSFGGRLRFAISGGAPISKDIVEFFHACDVLILEGYGLTETTAAVTVNVPFDYEFGTVGKPIGDVQIKIADDGEILIKSKKVMKEYYNDPDATALALDDGWLHTGDIGELTASGHLRITDRKKDLIKTAGGKYVAPQRIEGLLKLSPLISQVLVHGDNKKYVVALITLDPIHLRQLAHEKGLTYTDDEALTQHPAVLEIVRKGVAEANAHLASYESIKRFAVLPKDFSIEAGELTPSLKIKRKFVDQKYRNQIEKLYS